MSNAEMDYISHRILTKFATESNTTTSYVGDINIIGLGNSIGQFDDQRIVDDVGDHPSTGSTSTNPTTFYQNVDTASETSVVRPLQVAANGTIEINDTGLNSTIIAYTLAKVQNTSSYAVGQYYVGSTAPAGGTWTEEGSFTDTLTENGGTYQTWRLYRKTGDTTPSVVRPIKALSQGIQEMSDAEIDLSLIHI